MYQKRRLRVKANLTVERAARRKIGMKPETSSAIVMWMVRWAAMASSRYVVGKDGKVAYERRRGRQCRSPVVCIGEYVWYRELSTGAPENEFETVWKEGVWLGQQAV